MHASLPEQLRKALEAASLAATAVWGTQQLGFSPPGTNRFDGVFGIWYGKGPGMDQCSDVFKRANVAGTTEFGGVIAVADGDHISKSPTAARQSDHISKVCGWPAHPLARPRGGHRRGPHSRTDTRLRPCQVTHLAAARIQWLAALKAFKISAQ